MQSACGRRRPYGVWEGARVAHDLYLAMRRGRRRRLVVWLGGGDDGRPVERFWDRAFDTGRRPVLDDARQFCHERVDRDGRQGCGHDGDRDPDGDHAVHAGHGVVDDYRREGRADPGPQACVRDRLCDLRLRVVHHRDRTESRRLDARMVVSGGRWGGADPAGDRRARRVELFAGGAAAGVRAGRLGGRDRGSGRPPHRRAVHDLCLVAVGVRGRGPDRARDSRPRAADGRRDA
jgi:hypothetical protein